MEKGKESTLISSQSAASLLIVHQHEYTELCLHLSTPIFWRLHCVQVRGFFSKCNELSLVIDRALDCSLESCWFWIHLGGLYESAKLKSSYGHTPEDIVHWTISSSMEVTKLLGPIFGILNRCLSQTKWKLVQKYFLRDRPISLYSFHALTFISLPAMIDKQMALKIWCITFSCNFSFRKLVKSCFIVISSFLSFFFIWASGTPHFYSIAILILFPSKPMLCLSLESVVNILMKTWGRFYLSIYAMSWHFFNKTEYENSIKDKWQPATQT